MSEHAFDTLRFAERLEKTGMTREQASEVSKAFGDYIQEKLATKTDMMLLKEDLQQIKSELKSDISILKAELKSDMCILQERLTHKLTIRLGGMLVASITCLGFLMDWMLKGVH